MTNGTVVLQHRMLTNHQEDERMSNYYIHMEELDGLEEGYCCGSAERHNSPFHRTLDKQDADVYDDSGAISVSRGYKMLGYPCKVVPKVSDRRVLEILYG